MQDEKTVKIISAVKDMTDYEANILEAFICGFRAGKQVSAQEIRDDPATSPNVRAQ